MAVLKFVKKTILVLFMIALLPPSAVQAQDAEPMQLHEQKVKAGLVYNFLKFTTWPQSSFASGDKDIYVCLLGDDPFNGYLDPLEGRTAQQYTIRIKKITALRSIEGCHLLFVHSKQRVRLSELLANLDGKHILTVSDIKGFSQQGGMIELSKQQDKRIHIFANKEKIDAAGLGIQNRILKLAKMVD